MHQIYDERIARRRNTVQFRLFDYRAVDGVDFRLYPAFAVLIHRRIAMGIVETDFFHHFENLPTVKISSVRLRHVHRFIDQTAGKIPRVRILRQITDRGLRDCSECVDGGH